MPDATDAQWSPASSTNLEWPVRELPELSPEEPTFSALPELGGATPAVEAAEPDEEFDENDFDDDFDDDFEEELDDELNDDLDEFDEQVDGDEDLGDADSDEDAPFEEEEDF